MRLDELIRGNDTVRCHADRSDRQDGRSEDSEDVLLHDASSGEEVPMSSHDLFDLGDVRL